MICDGYLTRCGVLEYVQPDGSVRRELRPRDEVAKPASLATLEGRPVTDDHPSHMLTSDDALQHARGALASGAAMSGDHVYSRLSVLDRNLVKKMDDGVQQVSCGYECDLDNTPGVDPTYGRYDAIQRNINYNHVAILPRGRAGSARVRMDGVSVQVGDLATPHAHAIITPVSVARTDMQKPGANVVVDPDDEANRNARGANNAPVDDGGEPIGGLDVNLDDDQPDAYDVSYEDGVLTSAARDKMKASSFAVPDKEKLPIHDAPHVRAAMSRFGQTDFESTDEKHGAFNRIKKKAKELGVSSKGFEAKHGNKLDRVDHTAPRNTSDGESPMTEAEIKKLTDDLAAAKERADKAEAAAQNAKKDAEAGVAAEKARQDTAEYQARVSARVDLLTKANTILGATDKDGKAIDRSTRSDSEIKLEVIKFVDHDDVPADKAALPHYVDALFDGACKRFQRGDRAQYGARAAIEGARPTIEQPAHGAHADGETALPDERAAQESSRKAMRNAWKKPCVDAYTKQMAMDTVRSHGSK